MDKVYQLTTMRVWRTYTGGMRLNVINKQNSFDSNYPEDWLLSTTTAINPNEIMASGLSMLSKNNQTLKDLIDKDPLLMLGAKHFEQYQNNLALLVKMIDCKERLTIQVHPSNADANKYFNSRFGKTEAWYILNDKPSYVYIGFKNHVTRELWQDLFIKQDLVKMLDCLNRVSVKKGDVIFIPGGLVHAIGPDCLLLEVQEPTDYTIRTEKTTPSGLTITDQLIHQGLGFDKMFELFDYKSYTNDEIYQTFFKQSKVTNYLNYTKEILLDYNTTTNFKMVKYQVNNSLTLSNMQYYGIVILNGSGILKVAKETYKLTPGARFFVPSSTSSIKIYAKETLELITYFGPRV